MSINKAIVLTSAALAVDGVIVPFLTGKTLHEMVGIPPPGDYQIWGERTVRQAEAALWGVTMLYSIGTGLYKK